MQSSQVRNVGLPSNAEPKRDVPAWTQDPKIFPLDWFSVSRPNIIRQTKQYVSELSKLRNCSKIKTLSKLKAVLKRIMMFLHTHTSYIDEKSLLECDLEEDLITLVSLYMDMELRVLLIKKTATTANVTKNSDVGSEQASGLSNDQLISDRISYWLYTVLKAHEQRVDALLSTTLYTRHTRPVLDPIFRKILSEMPDGPFGNVNYVRHMLAYKTWRERVLIKDDETSSDLSALIEQRLTPAKPRSFPAPLRRCLGPGLTLKDHARPHSVNLPDACRHFMRFCREMPAAAGDHINFSSIPLLDDDLLGDEENEVNKLMNMISDRKQRKAASSVSQGSSMHVDAFIDLTESETKTAAVKDTPVSAIIDLTEEDEKPSLSLHPLVPTTNKRPPADYPYARASTAMPVPVEAHCFRSFSDNDIYLVNISCICPLRHRRECRCQQQEESKKLKKSASERNCVNESTYRRGCFRFAFGNQYDYPSQENVHTDSSSQDLVKMERITSTTDVDPIYSNNLCDCDECTTQNYEDRTYIRNASVNELSEPSTSFAANTNLMNHLPETLDKRKASSVLSVSESQSNSILTQIDDTLNCDSKQQIRKIKLPYITTKQTLTDNKNIISSENAKNIPLNLSNTSAEIENLCSEISELGCTLSPRAKNSSKTDDNFMPDENFSQIDYLKEATTNVTQHASVPETNFDKNDKNSFVEEYSNNDRKENNAHNLEDVQETTICEIEQPDLEETTIICTNFHLENQTKTEDTIATNDQQTISNNEETSIDQDITVISKNFEKTMISSTEIVEKVTEDSRIEVNTEEEQIQNSFVNNKTVEMKEITTNNEVIVSSIGEKIDALEEAREEELLADNLEDLKSTTKKIEETVLATELIIDDKSDSNILEEEVIQASETSGITDRDVIEKSVVEQTFVSTEFEKLNISQQEIELTVEEDVTNSTVEEQVENVQLDKAEVEEIQTTTIKDFSETDLNVENKEEQLSNEVSEEISTKLNLQNTKEILVTNYEKYDNTPEGEELTEKSLESEQNDINSEVIEETIITVNDEEKILHKIPEEISLDNNIEETPREETDIIENNKSKSNIDEISEIRIVENEDKQIKEETNFVNEEEVIKQTIDGCLEIEQSDIHSTKIEENSNNDELNIDEKSEIEMVENETYFVNQKEVIKQAANENTTEDCLEFEESDSHFIKIEEIPVDDEVNNFDEQLEIEKIESEDTQIQEETKFVDEEEIIKQTTEDCSLFKQSNICQTKIDEMSVNNKLNIDKEPEIKMVESEGKEIQEETNIVDEGVIIQTTEDCSLFEQSDICQTKIDEISVNNKLNIAKESEIKMVESEDKEIQEETNVDEEVIIQTTEDCSLYEQSNICQTKIDEISVNNKLNIDKEPEIKMVENEYKEIQEETNVVDEEVIMQTTEDCSLYEQRNICQTKIDEISVNNKLNIEKESEIKMVESEGKEIQEETNVVDEEVIIQTTENCLEFELSDIHSTKIDENSVNNKSSIEGEFGIEINENKDRQIQEDTNVVDEVKQIQKETNVVDEEKQIQKETNVDEDKQIQEETNVVDENKQIQEETNVVDEDKQLQEETNVVDEDKQIQEETNVVDEEVIIQTTENCLEFELSDIHSTKIDENSVNNKSSIEGEFGIEINENEDRQIQEETNIVDKEVIIQTTENCLEFEQSDIHSTKTHENTINNKSSIEGESGIGINENEDKQIQEERNVVDEEVIIQTKNCLEFEQSDIHSTKIDEISVHNKLNIDKESEIKLVENEDKQIQEETNVVDEEIIIQTTENCLKFEQSDIYSTKINKNEDRQIQEETNCVNEEEVTKQTTEYSLDFEQNDIHSTQMEEDKDSEIKMIESEDKQVQEEITFVDGEEVIKQTTEDCSEFEQSNICSTKMEEISVNDKDSEIKIVENETNFVNKEEVIKQTASEKTTENCSKFEQNDNSTKMKETEEPAAELLSKLNSEIYNANLITTEETIITNSNNMVHSNIQEQSGTIENVIHETINESLINEHCEVNEIIINNEEQISTPEIQSELSKNMILDFENVVEEIVIESEVGVNSDKTIQGENKNTISKSETELLNNEISHQQEEKLVKNRKKRKISEMQIKSDDYEGLNILTRKRRKTKAVTKENMTHKNEDLYQKPIYHKNDVLGASKRRKIRSFNADAKLPCESDLTVPANLESEVLPDVEHNKEIDIKVNSEAEKPKRRRKQNLKEIILDDKPSSVHKKDKELFVLCKKLSQKEIDVFLQNKFIGKLETKLTEKRNNIKKKLHLLDCLEEKPKNTKIIVKKITINSSEISKNIIADEPKNNKTKNKQKIRNKIGETSENLEICEDTSQKFTRSKNRPSNNLTNKVKFFSDNFNLKTTEDNPIKTDKKTNKLADFSVELSEDDIPLTILRKRNLAKSLQNVDSTIKSNQKPKTKVYQSTKTKKKEILKTEPASLEETTKPKSFNKKLAKFKFQPKIKNDSAVKLDENTPKFDSTTVEEFPNDLTFKYKLENKTKRSIKTYSKTNKSKTLELSEEVVEIGPKNCKETDVNQFKNTDSVLTCNESNISVKNNSENDEKRVEIKVPLPRAEQIKIKKYREIPTNENFNISTTEENKTICQTISNTKSELVCSTEISKEQFIVASATDQSSDVQAKINDFSTNSDGFSTHSKINPHFSLIPKMLFSKKAREKIFNSQTKSKEIVTNNEIISEESNQEKLKQKFDSIEVEQNVANVIKTTESVVHQKNEETIISEQENAKIIKLPDEKSKFAKLKLDVNNEPSSLPTNELNLATKTPILDLYKNKMIKIEDNDNNLKEIRAFNEVISKVARIRESLEASTKKEKKTLSENNTVNSNTKYESVIKYNKMYPWPKGFKDRLEHCPDQFSSAENPNIPQNVDCQTNDSLLSKKVERFEETDLDQDDVSNSGLIIDTSAESSDVEESLNKPNVVIDDFNAVISNIETNVSENIVENSSFNEEIEIPMSISEETVVENIVDCPVVEKKSCEIILQNHSVGFITEDDQMNEEVTQFEIKSVDKEIIQQKSTEMLMFFEIGLESCLMNQNSSKLGEHAIVSYVKCSVNGKQKNNKKVVIHGTHNELEECISINVPEFEICQAKEIFEPEKFTAKVESPQVFTNDNPVVDNYKLCILADIAMNSVYLNTKTENNNVIEITSERTNEIQNQCPLKKDERCFFVTFPDKVPTSNQPTTNMSIINSNNEEVSVNVQKLAGGLNPKGVVLENKIQALTERAKNHTKTNGENLLELYASLENICEIEINKLTKTPPKQEEQVICPTIDIPPKVPEPNITFDIPNTTLLHLSPDDDDFMINQNIRTETNDALMNFNLQSSNTAPVEPVQVPEPSQNIDLDPKVVKYLYNIVDSLTIDQKVEKKETNNVTTKEIKSGIKSKSKKTKNASLTSSNNSSETSYLLNKYKSNCDSQNKSESNTQQKNSNNTPSYIRSSRPQRVVTTAQPTTIKRNNNVLKNAPVEEPAKKKPASEKIFDKLLEEYRKEVSEAKLKNETSLDPVLQPQNPKVTIDKPESSVVTTENIADNAKIETETNEKILPVVSTNEKILPVVSTNEKILSVVSTNEKILSVVSTNEHETNKISISNEEEKINKEVGSVNNSEESSKKDSEEDLKQEITNDKNIIQEKSGEKETEIIREVEDADNRNSAIEVVQDWFNRVDNKEQQESYSEITTYQTIEDCNFFEEVSNSCENSPIEQKNDEKIFTKHQTPDSGIFDEDSVQKEKSLDAQTPLQENISDCETYYQPNCAPVKTYFCNVDEIDSSDNIQEEIQITDVRLVKPTESSDISNMKLKVSIALEKIKDIIPLLTKYKISSLEQKNKKRKEQNEDFNAEVKKRKYTGEETSVNLKKRKFSTDDNIIEDYIAEEVILPAPSQNNLSCSLRTKGSVKEYPDCLFGITESPVPSGSFHSPYPSDISLTEEPTFYEEGGIDLCNDYPVYDSFEVLKEQQSLIQKESFVVDDNPKDVQPGLQAGYSVIDSQFLPLSEYMNDGDYILIDNIIFNDKRMVPVNMHQVQPETKPHNSEETKRSEFDDSEKEDSLSETVDEIIKNPNLFPEQSTSEVHVISMDQDTSDVQVVIACDETDTSSDTYLYGIPLQTEQINNGSENVTTSEVQVESLEVETSESVVTDEQVDLKPATIVMTSDSSQFCNSAAVTADQQQPSMEHLTAVSPVQEISEPIVINTEDATFNDLQSHNLVENQNDFSKSCTTSASNISFETNKNIPEYQVAAKGDEYHSKSPPKVKSPEHPKVYEPKPIKLSSSDKELNNKELQENTSSRRTPAYSKINDWLYKDRSYDYQHPRKYSSHKSLYSDARKPISKPYDYFHPKQHSSSKTQNQKVPDAFDRLKQEDRSRYSSTERREASRYQPTDLAHDHYKRCAPQQDKSRLSQSAYTEPSPKTTYRMPPSDPSYRNSHNSNYKIEGRKPEVRSSRPESKDNQSGSSSNTHKDWLNNSTLLSLIKTANTIYKKKY